MSGTLQLWVIILGLGLGSFALRFAFLGLIGDRALPPWLLRHLRYTGVSLLPALVAPIVVWPDSAGGSLDPTRMAAGATALCVGYFTKNVALAVRSGAGVFYGLLSLL